MTTLLNRLNDICQTAFEKAGHERRWGLVRVSDRPDIADFQCNGLLAIAKQQKLNPQAVAEQVLVHLDQPDIFSVEFVRPGFLNFTIADAALREQAVKLIADDRSLVEKVAKPMRFLLDYGGPNLAKEMHVGHLRSSIVGQTLNTILAFMGHETIGDVHLGDWGLQIGQLISQIEDERPELLSGDAAATLDMADLQAWYPRASARSKEDETFLDRARRATAAMQAGKPEYLELWRRIVGVSTESLKRDFDRLGVHFDVWYGESRYQGALDQLVDRLIAAGKAQLSEGAVIVPMPEEDGLPPLILRNSNGSYGYGATDLATIEDRIATDKPDVILYVVDARQKLHFRQVFHAAKVCGLLGDAEAEHIAFGTVNGTDGKPFKTRAGGVMRLHDLFETMSGAARDRLDEVAGIPAEDRAEVSENVAAAAIKFGELSHDREQNYVFNVDQFLQFEGKTGPYIQYSCVRVRSLMVNAARAGLEPGVPSILGDGGRDLILCLDELPAQIDRAIEARKPSFIANHVYKLANRMNSFYQANRILSDGIAPETAISHLTILRAATRQLELCMTLLGIAIPKAM